MNAQVVIIVFEIVVFLFAISVHESSHAWMANRLGDPTARMLGRISLNPIRHIDIVGTILLPALAVISHVPLLGWAKPTPVDTRNFKNPVLDDVLTAVIGPISNFVVAIGCFIVLVVIAKTSMQGLIIVQSLAQRRLVETSSSLMPTALLFHEALKINVLLGIFNLIPLPPLDGSHVIRHFLPDGIRRGFDMAGIALLWILVLFGGNFLGALLGSAMNLFDSPLMRL
ncbi:MAG: site-2 protease family protein [Terriglobales bacterium]|jgi:Zn-dependent protease